MMRTGPAAEKSRIARSMGKAKILMEAMPYIQEFKGKTVVVKYGGSAMTDESLRHSFAGDVALLSHVGIRPVVVHGGGPQITKAMGQVGVEPQWVEGLRVTDAETMRVVQMTLAGEINPDIVRLLGGHGAMASGITGIDGALFTAKAKDPRLGFVGEITGVNPDVIQRMVVEGMVPVIAPLALGEGGEIFNVNADTAAGALAEALDAEKLVYLTDVEGLYLDLGDKDSLMQRATVDGLEELIGGGTVSAGMLPKLESCVSALRGGVRRGHILDGRVQHAVLLEIFTKDGIGTLVVPE